METGAAAGDALPDPTRRWGADEMAQAAAALTDIAQRDPRRLPTYGSQSSGIVFSRITARENLESFEDSAVPIGDRVGAVARFGQALSAITKLYLSSATARGDISDEIVELNGAALGWIREMLLLADQFAPTLKKDDPSYVTRMSGLDGARRAGATEVLRVLGCFAQRPAIRQESLRRLVGHMAETLPDLVAHLAPDARTEVVRQLASIAADPNMRDLEPGVSRLHDQVDAAVAKAPSALPGLVADDLKKKGITVHRAQVGEPDRWNTARSTGGGFSVRLPGRFNDLSTSAPPDDKGVVVSTDVVGTTTLGGVKFAAMATSRSDGKAGRDPVDKMVDDFRAEGIAVEKHPVRLAGRPATEVVVDSKDSSVVFRVLAVGDKLYMLTVEYRPDLKNSIGTYLEPFFNSFELPAVSAGSVVTTEPEPASALEYFNRGNARYDAGRAELAIADYTRAIELQPGFVSAYFNRGNLHRDRGEYDLAIEDYTRSLEMDAMAGAFINRGLAFGAKGDHDREIADYTSALEHEPQNTIAYVDRGEAYADNKHAYDKAITDYDRALAIDPKKASALADRAEAYYHEGKYDRALSDARAAKQLGYEVSPEFLEKLERARQGKR